MLHLSLHFFSLFYCVLRLCVQLYAVDVLVVLMLFYTLEMIYSRLTS